MIQVKPTLILNKILVHLKLSFKLPVGYELKRKNKVETVANPLQVVDRVFLKGFFYFIFIF